MPPASAGTNGSTDPHAASVSGEMFAHTPVANSQAGTAILLTGIALAPPNAPEAVKGAIDAANTIVGRPYVWGGGHGSFLLIRVRLLRGSQQLALFGGGLIPRPLASTELESWGAPGPGRWITVYANAGHACAEIARPALGRRVRRRPGNRPALAPCPRPPRRLRRAPPSRLLWRNTPRLDSNQRPAA